MTYKLTFEYFNHYDEKTHTSLFGHSEQDVCDRAYKWALENGDGEFSPVNMIKSVPALNRYGMRWEECSLPEVGHYYEF